MTAVTFDTLQFVKTLESKGFNAKQAEGINEALKNALTVAEICTKQDLQRELAETKAEIIKWNTGAIVGSVAMAVTLIKLLGG